MRSRYRPPTHVSVAQALTAVLQHNDERPSRARVQRIEQLHMPYVAVLALSLYHLPQR